MKGGIQKERAMDKQMVEEVTIDGRTVQLTYEDVPIEKIGLDEDNPRIRYRLKLQQNGKSLEQVILAMPEVKALQADIKRNGGLRERVILQPSGTKLKALEGNVRVTCIEDLHKRYKDDARWKTVPARILPKDVDPKQIAILLADFHVAGKITWKAHEKAGHVYRMVHDLQMTMDEITTYLRSSKSTITRLEQAYKFMVEKFLKIDDEKYAKQGERKWSYFEEFFKIKPLREEYKKNAAFGDNFCRWVGDGRLPEGENVRSLSAIISNQDAYKKFVGAPVADAFKAAMKIVEQTDPEFGSAFFKQMAEFRDSCMNAAQVKEILRIRTDKVARQRVLDTYSAFVGFMRLADVEPEPEEEAK
jgi:hypothetical protein